MFTQKQTTHQHNYTKLGFVRDSGPTETRMIHRIILTRSCDCGDSEAFECGDREDMKQLYAQLKAKEQQPS